MGCRRCINRSLKLDTDPISSDLVVFEGDTVVDEEWKELLLAIVTVVIASDEGVSPGSFRYDGMIELFINAHK